MPRRRRLKGCRCKFSSPAEQTRKLRPFLRKYGDDIPESEIRQSTAASKLHRWYTVCDCSKPNEPIGVMRWDKSDWYLCTLKNAAVKKDVRERGVGGKIYRGAAQKALRSKSCLVLAADVTFDNEESKYLLEKQGFKVVNRFCWQRGKKPADILHYVRIPPRGWVKGAC